MSMMFAILISILSGFLLGALWREWRYRPKVNSWKEAMMAWIYLYFWFSPRDEKWHTEYAAGIPDKQLRESVDLTARKTLFRIIDPDKKRFPLPEQEVKAA